ncbi:hypothetical protein [Pontiella sp.]|uniref:hypothetical protein n=1 Tax=Pontiella sp. TaxID=2837462 RepID=UPI003565B090
MNIQTSYDSVGAMVEAHGGVTAFCRIYGLWSKHVCEWLADDSPAHLRRAQLWIDGPALSPRYSWVITEDHAADDASPEGTPDNAAGMTAGSDLDTRDELELYEADLLPIPHSGEKFRVYDADRQLLHEGLAVLHDCSGLEVLVAVNRFDSAAVEIAFLSGLNGNWELLALSCDRA